ncbi:transporter, UIT6 family [Verrucomicrobium sp. GAS474]|uniref:sodium:proton antiporter n=1 Tax=Verrucomicrobium sp. GAS474 TaxID=1882831 RepID=UPI00087DDDDB|nr:sodium:proton antiporter [Verrucomicrobium sp. GAS474]SDU11447.1 transporter, UIT6 family [Verrucomicrobium sp. GAS474]
METPPLPLSLPIWTLIPFALLLGAIALGPLLHREGWERHYPKVAVLLGAATASYFLLWLHRPGPLLHAVGEYAGFMALIASLFVIAGGIHVTVPEGGGTPGRNTAFLALGAVLANFFGTTGAAVLLIRPWLRMNEGSVTPRHVVFFIFLVGNVGGCLTPMGDPPLFLGFLKGVPFFWPLLHLWKGWLMATGLLLAVFYVLERRARGRRTEPLPTRQRRGSIAIHGKINVLFLGFAVGALFLPSPWREAVLVAMAAASFFATPAHVHRANAFSLAPLREVAWLFAGIFITMAPALEILPAHAPALGLTTPQAFYWMTGMLSAILDNAPTYVTFLAASIGLHGGGGPTPDAVLAETSRHGIFVVAISLGAVFFGAMTYIGNGPNFMIKAVAEEAGVTMPGFFGYLFRYAVPILLPILFVVAWAVL